ncbi:transketolase family protein [Candidatus Methanomassiliicoccus intestinalis]|jgi:transketolase subunit B|uniref:Transketolase, C-terminal subunit n=1 Tax=Methanomassiliicoccus intestinalis (strain Issoire-Mx1) TaxID=1295009 RepID=R9TBI4_METII|nr:transketolase family protein [Candidatus Methanomassiliicoccus intestinalis]AGN27066.1 Transketolase, C-terminal subunit [Candidatus Methanomassiliicoccus intestinalis Issoire-Mx1]TQS80962.1 MAG: transketolase [Candidatus Methanomassiliicoccus intestinalis]
MKWMYTSQRKEYANALTEVGKERTDVVVLDADLSSSTRTAEFAKNFPERFFNCGIAEQNMIGTAAGLAAAGKTVFASTFAAFATGRCWDQIRQAVAYSNLDVKIVATHAGITVGPDGATHQALEDIAIMRVLPNMTVIVPADGAETYKAIKAIANYKGPCYVRLGRSDVPLVTSMETPFEVGKASLLKEGSDITLAACGQMVAICLEAAEELESRGISAEVLNVSTIKPLDKDAIAKSVEKTGCIVTAEEHSIEGGLGSAVCEFLCETYSVPQQRIGTPACFGESGESDALMKKYGLTKEHVVEASEKVIRRKKQ